MLKKTTLALSILCCTTVQAQQPTDSIQKQVVVHPSAILANNLQQSFYKQGQVKLHKDVLLDSLFILDKQVNLQQGTKGYRVQLYNSNRSGSISRNEAFALRARYYALFPNGDHCYTYFNSPFWIVRIGDYRQVHEALKMKQQLERAFPDIKDEISVQPNTVIETKKRGS